MKICVGLQKLTYMLENDINLMSKSLSLIEHM